CSLTSHFQVAHSPSCFLSPTSSIPDIYTLSLHDALPIYYEYIRARDHVDWPRRADLRRSGQPRLPGFSVPAVAEAAIDLSESRSAAPGLVPPGPGDQRRAERKRRCGE